jgi:hypothetical protein
MLGISKSTENLVTGERAVPRAGSEQSERPVPITLIQMMSVTKRMTANMATSPNPPLVMLRVTDIGDELVEQALMRMTNFPLVIRLGT